MRKATVIRNLEAAWDMWEVEIPDDAPEDPKELLTMMHNDDIEINFLHQLECDHYDADICEFIDIDPKPELEPEIPATPEWWQRVYGDLYKTNLDLLEKLAIKYEADGAL
jgi:hypothetical protein